VSVCPVTGGGLLDPRKNLIGIGVPVQEDDEIESDELTIAETPEQRFLLVEELKLLISTCEEGTQKLNPSLREAALAVLLSEKKPQEAAIEFDVRCSLLHAAIHKLRVACREVLRSMEL
jgi:DNA-directed RNA polymerase specialized sigma24 family protein